MKHKQAGFTMVELLVGLALTAIIMAGLAGMLTNLLGHGVRGVDLIDRQQEARWVLDMVAQDIRFARPLTMNEGSVSDITIDKTDSRGKQVQVRYYLADAGTENGTRVLNRQMSTSTAVVDSPVGNPERGYLGEGDFSVTPSSFATVLVEGVEQKRVKELQLVYRVRRDEKDTSPATAQTTVHLLNFYYTHK